MKSVQKVLLLMIFLQVCAVGCSRIQVESDYDRAANFKEVKSFAVSRTRPHNDSGEIFTSEIVHRRIGEAIKDRLRRKGLIERDENSADILIGYRTVVEPRVEVRSSQIFATYGYSDGWYGGSWAPQLDVYQYTQGTLVIDAFDRSNKSLIWRGLGQSVISRNSSSPEEIQASVQAILDQFPPPSPSAASAAEEASSKS